MNGIRILVGDLNAELLRAKICQQPYTHSIKDRGVRHCETSAGVVLTSSIAITTSTVSKLSRPRSFAKCAVDLICIMESISSLANYN